MFIAGETVSSPTGPSVMHLLMRVVQDHHHHHPTTWAVPSASAANCITETATCPSPPCLKLTKTTTTFCVLEIQERGNSTTFYHHHNKLPFKPLHYSISQQNQTKTKTKISTFLFFPFAAPTPTLTATSTSSSLRISTMKRGQFSSQKVLYKLYYIWTFLICIF